MHGGLTTEEFDHLRSDLQQLVSDHPRAKFTILLLDREGHRTEDLSAAVRYGLTAYEHDKLIYEEMGIVVKGIMTKG
jgi:hypothetical protein